MVPTDKVVHDPVKIDLHIHSAASSHKDGTKVKDGTADNIDVLFERLEQNQVNMIAITDHDIFDYDVYSALCKKVSEAEHLQKVLPGVEFTVSFKTDDGNKTVHVVTIFDDSNPALVRKIADAIPLDKNHKPQYGDGSAFTEDEYWNIIRKIGLDIVAIAHQKNSLTSSTRKTNDANSVGDELFNEFLFVDYFEAYEYKNRRNELFNKSYSYSSEQQDCLRFITGSDCHVWKVYPSYDNQPTPSDVNFAFTYLKCLPTFRGLAMAITDISRIKTVPSFFSGSSKTLNSIDLTLNGAEISIPLSPGINAVIGDNSIGKSSLLNALTNFKYVTATVKKGQEGYLAKMGLALQATIPDQDVFQYDGQDAIRKNFEKLSVGKAKKQLEVHFPDPIDNKPFKSFAMGQFRLYMSALKDSCEYQAAIESLSNYFIPKTRPLDAPESITFEKEVKLDDASPHKGLISEIDAGSVQLSSATENYSDILTKEDEDDFKTIFASLEYIKQRHNHVAKIIELEKQIANKIIEAVSGHERKQNKVITDAQKSLSDFQHSISRIGQSIADAVMREQSLRDFSFNFKPMAVIPNVNPVGELQFVCKLSVDSITPKLLNELLNNLISKTKVLNTFSYSYQDVIDAIKNYPDDEEDPLVVLRNRFEDGLDAKLKSVMSINRENDDVYDELSRGYNSQMYFALMADRSIGDGIYIVDQPEDQISQKAIKESVLGEFRDIASSRQVILITHNPQFIVNLDVDNVIFIGKSEDKLSILSGALEYECADYNMLDIVAENIEGGLDTIQRRMKRYEKAN